MKQPLSNTVKVRIYKSTHRHALQHVPPAIAPLCIVREYNRGDMVFLCQPTKDFAQVTCVRWFQAANETLYDKRLYACIKPPFSPKLTFVILAVCSGTGSGAIGVPTWGGQVASRGRRKRRNPRDGGQATSR